MNLTRSKNSRFLFWLITIIGIIIGCIVVLRNVNIYHQNQKKTNLLPLERENWQGYVKIQTAFKQLEHNWDKTIIQRNNKDNLELQAFIKQEFERQIVEIKKVSTVEAGLKQAELDRIFRDYCNRRLKELEQKYQQKASAQNNQINRAIQQKKIELDQQYKKFKHDLEMVHQLNLVNLQLQLSIMDLKPNNARNLEEKNQIQLKIEQINQDINQECATQKEILQTLYLEYEKQQLDHVAEELNILKNNLKTEYETDVRNYRSMLESEFYAWCEKQNIQFEKAIQVRQGAKRKTN